jgi:acyl-coenzyme A synthetase/AMP-(fatty) acid ligase/acyl carrier protein
LTQNDRCSQIASPGFDASVWELWPALASGASVHVPSDEVRSRPDKLRNWLVTERITVSFVPTPLAELLLVLDWPSDTALRFLLTGGDVLHRHPEPGLPFTVVNNYGPSECTVVASSGVVEPSIDARYPPSLGEAIDGVTTAIVDEYLRPVQPGNEGELLIGGVGIAQGYVNQPELTAERFIMVRTGGAHETSRMYRTGDLVRTGLHGELHFLGRVDSQVKIRGRRIELGEIGATLDTHPDVSSSVVVVIESGTGEKRLVAFVVACAGSDVGSTQLRAHLAERLPDYMVPQTIVFLDELPLTTNGKVDHAALPAPGRIAPGAPAGRLSPSNELEEYLVGTVAELLGQDMVAVDDNFFLLGGHSLLGAQLIARIADRFGVDLPLRTLFDAPTVAGMAEQVERLLVAEVAAMSDESVAELLSAEGASSFSGGGIDSGDNPPRN